MRLYLLPRIGDGRSPDTAFRPAYMEEQRMPWSGTDYPAGGVYLILADPTDAQHAWICAQPGVWHLPLSDDPIGSLAPEMSRCLHALHMPAAWCTDHSTWRGLIRRLIAGIAVHHRSRGGLVDPRAQVHQLPVDQPPVRFGSEVI